MRIYYPVPAYRNFNRSFLLLFIDNDDLLRLELKDIGLEFSWPVGRIKEALSGIDVPNSSTPTSCSAESIKSLAILVEELNLPEANIGIAAGVLAFLWLYSSIQGYGTVVCDYFEFLAIC